MKSKGKQITLSLALLLAGGILILAGVLRGEAQTVLEKAIRICVECIGLG
ncbi:MAG: thioredoxin [Clostridia bacterium]|nr:thioredoxin [Clostridia bacterium]